MPGERLSHSADKAAQNPRVPISGETKQREKKKLLILPTGIVYQIPVNHDHLEGKGFPLPGKHREKPIKGTALVVQW